MPRDKFRLAFGGEGEGYALHVAVDWRVELCDVDPSFLDHGVFVHDSVYNALANDFEKLGAKGHFFFGDGIERDIIYRIREVIGGYRGAEVRPYRDVHLVVGTDGGFFLHATVVGVEANAVDVYLV